MHGWDSEFSLLQRVPSLPESWDMEKTMLKEIRMIENDSNLIK